MNEIVSRKEAVLRSLKYYFTGEPCKRGHIARRQVSNNTCSECQRIARRKHRILHLEICLERTRKWQSENPGKAKYSWTRYRLANPEKVKLASQLWKKSNPGKRLLYRHRYRANQVAAEGSHTLADVAAIRKAQHNKCAYCREKLGRGSHLDHIIPLSGGGTNWPSNLQWLCASCNTSKQARDPIDFAQSRGLLL